MGKFVLTKRKNDEYQFNLKADNGQVILTSQGYSSKAACQSGIDSVKANAENDHNYQRKLSADNKHFFNLTASNGQVIGTSEMYESKAACENGIASVMKNAPNAAVADEA